MSAAALLTASATKFTEAAIQKTDVNFMLVAYIYYRIVSTEGVAFEEYVNKHHEWEFDAQLKPEFSIDNITVDSSSASSASLSPPLLQLANPLTSTLLPPFAL